MSSSQPQSADDKMISQLSSSLDALGNPSDKYSSADAIADQIVSIGLDYIAKMSGDRARSSATVSDPTAADDADGTPGASTYFYHLWSILFAKVQEGPTTDDAHREHIDRLVQVVRRIKNTKQPDNQPWTAYGEKANFKDLPMLGWEARDLYNEPIDTMERSQDTLLSSQFQSAVACPYYSGFDHFADDASRVGADRHKWLALQDFLSRLWRDAGCDNYAVYAIWAIRSGIEDWPSPPPSFDVAPDSFEVSPAYHALEVEAAAIWICNTAPLMYACREIWGKNGNPSWPDNAGTPGRGGSRWKGVDGYDAEHQRWLVWKQTLKEIIEWCDAESAKGHMQGWKVKQAAVEALEAMQRAETSAAAAA